MAHRRFGAGVLASLAGLAALGGVGEVSAASRAERPVPTPDVVVTAEPGPALWRVGKGASEVIILGTMAPTPDGATWNTRVVAAALQGARMLMLSPGSTPGLAWADDFPDTQRYRLGQPFGRTLAAELAPGEATRLAAMATTIHRPWSRYNHYRPGPAGMILLEDSWSARGLTGSQVDDTVVALAEAAHVHVVRVDEGGALPLLDAMPSMSEEQQTACIGQAMDQFDREGVEANVGFRAWAGGDLATLSTTYRPVDLCVDIIPGGPRRRSRANALWLKALEAALQAPGRTVALMDVSDLLKPSGLLDALEADGATVIAPRNEPEGKRVTPFVIVKLPQTLDGPAPSMLIARPLPALPEHLRLASAQKEGGSSNEPGSVCVSIPSVGSLLPHTVCHTRAEWDALERGKSSTQLRDLLRDNPSLHGRTG